MVMLILENSFVNHYCVAYVAKFPQLIFELICNAENGSECRNIK